MGTCAAVAPKAVVPTWATATMEVGEGPSARCCAINGSAAAAGTEAVVGGLAFGEATKLQDVGEVTVADCESPGLLVGETSTGGAGSSTCCRGVAGMRSLVNSH